MKMGMTPEGPWTPCITADIESVFKKAYGLQEITPKNIATGIENGSINPDITGYADPQNGVIRYVQVNGSVFAVTDLFVLHAEGAEQAFEVMEVDKDGDSLGEVGTGDRVMKIFEAHTSSASQHVLASVQKVKTVQRYTDTNHPMVGVVYRGAFRETEGMKEGEEVQLRLVHGTCDWSPDGEVWYELPPQPSGKVTLQPSGKVTPQPSEF